MKRYLVYRKKIEISDKNSLWCSRQCKYVQIDLCNHSYYCKLNDEKLILVEDGKPFPETFLRSGECLEREMQNEM